jgi:RNA polymerase sigma factor for flagellar operon FliA
MLGSSVADAPRGNASAGLEARYFPRAALRLGASMVVSDIESRVIVTNLSEGGAFLETAVVTAIGTELIVRVELPQDVTPFFAAVVVRRVLPASGAGPEGLGVSWCDLDDADAVLIRRLVEANDAMFWEPSPQAIPRALAVDFIPKIRRLARQLAQRLPVPSAADDLVGAGFVGLVECYARFEDKPEEERERCVMARVRGAMLDELRRSDPLSRRMRHRQRRIESATRTLERDLERQPSEAEIAKHLSLSNDEVDSALRVSWASRTTSLDARERADVPDEGATGPEELASRGESIERLRVALSALPERLRKVLELYYGDDLTLRDIGNVLGVTEGRISQLLSEAVKKLKESCASDVPPPHGAGGARGRRAKSPS